MSTPEQRREEQGFRRVVRSLRTQSDICAACPAHMKHLDAERDLELCRNLLARIAKEQNQRTLMALKSNAAALLARIEFSRGTP